MALIGFMPTATTVEVREPDGDGGTIPGATPRAAGVMTAQQARMLDEAHAAIGLVPVRPARALDDPQSPDVQNLIAEVRDIRIKITGLEAAERQPSAPKIIEPAAHNAIPASKVADMASRLEIVEQRMSAVERNGFLQSANDDGDDDPLPMPLHMRRAAHDASHQIRPTHQIAMADLMMRLASVEESLASLVAASEKSRAEPSVRTGMSGLDDAIRAATSAAPPIRLTESAHLARAGQEQSLAMMEMIAESSGCTWEEAAVSIIRAHDRAAWIDATAWAIRVGAERRISNGEPEDVVIRDSLRAIEGIGG
jgi:hypothetical protein